MGSLPTPAAIGLTHGVLLIVVPFAVDEPWIAKVEAQHPGLKVRWISRPNRLPPDPLPNEVYDDVTMLCTFAPHPIELLPKLRYVQLLSAGADRWIPHDLYKKPDIIFCTANGAHSYVVVDIRFPSHWY